MSTTTTIPRATVDTAITVTDLDIGVIGADLILDKVSFDLHPGRILALVGESGSGKTTAALACMNHLRRGLEIRGGTVVLHEGASRFVNESVDVLTLSDKRIRQLRGGTIAYVPQDPALSLNGALRVGEQIHEVLRTHEFGRNAAERDKRVVEVLEEVGLPGDKAYQRRFPHQLSGGQQQRIGIAMAFACRPAVIIMDEPTTGLDVATQDLVLKTIYELTTKHDVAGLYITHDLAVVAQVANDVAVMLRGRIVETGPADQVLYRPHHDYTRRLLAAVPDLAGQCLVGGGEAVSPNTALLPQVPARGTTPAESDAVDAHQSGTDTTTVTHEAPQGDHAASTSLRQAPWESHPAQEPTLGREHGNAQVRPRAATRSTTGAGGDTLEPVSEFHEGGRARRKPKEEPQALVKVRNLTLAYGSTQILDGIDLDLPVGRTTMLLGESGSGKTTFSRCISGLNSDYEGSVTLDGEELARGTRQRTDEQRRRIQYVFQSPFSSLNPRRTIGDSLQVPLEMDGRLNRAERRAAVADALDAVRLGRSYIDRRPGDLSGGERQRAAVARALVNAPSVLVCDEITSALDVSVQASVIELLRDLQRERGLAMLFVTHNIALARHISHKLAVLEKGKLVDYGPTDQVLRYPDHHYTQALLDHVPQL